MKSTGIVRKIDDLGRVVIPKEIRRNMNINESDPLEFFMNGDQIILKKYQPGCHECGEVNVDLHGEKVKLCYECIETMDEQAKAGLPKEPWGFIEE